MANVNGFCKFQTDSANEMQQNAEKEIGQRANGNFRDFCTILGQREDESYGWTGPMWASYFGRLDCLGLQIIVYNRGIIDVCSKRFQQTPLHAAAFAGHDQCVLWLVRHGASVNKQDHLFETPVHKAARTGRVECLNVLIAHGADLSLMNSDGLTAAAISLACGHQEAYRVLLASNSAQSYQNGVFHPSLDFSPNWIESGLNGGHLPFEAECLETKREGRESCEMDIDSHCSLQNGRNNDQNPSLNFLSGRKRSHDGLSHDFVKRMRSVEEVKNVDALEDVENSDKCVNATSAPVNGTVFPCLPQHQSVYGIYDINRHFPRCMSGCYI